METVEGATYELLNALTDDPRFARFNLAGGTALALYLGHRLSIDLDMFSDAPFDAPELEHYLKEKYDFQGSYLEKIR